MREEAEPDAGQDADDRGSHELLLGNRREPGGFHGYNLTAPGGQQFTTVPSGEVLSHTHSPECKMDVSRVYFCHKATTNAEKNAVFV